MCGGSTRSDVIDKVLLYQRIQMADNNRIFHIVFIHNLQGCDLSFQDQTGCFLAFQSHTYKGHKISLLLLQKEYKESQGSLVQIRNPGDGQL